MTVQILLAEDNDRLSQMLQRFLAGHGFQVLAAKTGAEALQILASQEIRLLLLDLRLPQLNGIQVLQKLRATPRWATLPVVIMTGIYKGDRFAEAARRLGVRAYLEKPFSPETLLSAVRSALEEHPPAKTRPTLAQQVADIYVHRKSGLLSLETGPPVCFFHGEPISFLARGRDEFAAFLLARGKIGPTDRQLIVESAEERLFINQTGLMSYDELEEESRIFFTKHLADALAHGSPGEFAPGINAAEPPLVPLCVPRLLYDAARRPITDARSAAFVGQYGHLYPVRTDQFFRRGNLIAMDTEDIELLGRITGERSVNDVLAPCIPKGRGVSCLQFLISLGMIALHDGPAAEAVPDFPQKNIFNRPLEEPQMGEEPVISFEDVVAEVSQNVGAAVGEAGMDAPLSPGEIGFELTVRRDAAFVKDKNYYALFGLTQGSFSFNALKEAYFAKIRQYSPEQFMELSGATQGMAQEVLAIYANAYNTLSNVVAKERYDEMLNSGAVGLDGKRDERLQAKIQFQSGSVFLAMGEYDNAEKAFQEAYTLEPENAMHCAHLGWAIYKNPQGKGSKSAQDRARALLGKSLMIEKTTAAYVFRGWMLLEEGRDALAEGEFQKALRLTPSETMARKGLEQIAEKRESERKGFFRKIFG